MATWGKRFWKRLVEFRDSALASPPCRWRSSPGLSPEEVKMGIQKHFNSLEELLAQSPVPVLVEFTTELCGPCRMMNPILEQVQATLKPRVQIVKLDSEKYTDLAHTYQIHALPTLILFKQGQVVGRTEGLVPPERLIEWLKLLI